MKDKITIGIFVDTFFPMTDGVAMVVDNYARRLIKYANVIVFTPSYIESDFDDSVLPYKVVRCYSLKTYFWDYNLPIPKLDKKFKKILDSYKLDIVHINSPFTVNLSVYEKPSGKQQKKQRPSSHKICFLMRGEKRSTSRQVNIQSVGWFLML